ncbi:MAG: class I SAM-dependent methyltransferase [Caulobacteraceae bacterium]
MSDTVSASRRLGALARYAVLQLRGNDRTHYTRDYRRMVQRLISKYPLDEAMSRAVGGFYNEIGQLQSQILLEAGLKTGERLLDLGCGSGRLANALRDAVEVDYLGLDIIPELLAYARTRSPPTYRFMLNTKLSIPAPDAQFDMACAFSVFTHLHHEETFLYLRDLARVLRPGGRLVFSFLEFRAPQHWEAFDRAVQAVSASQRLHLDMFIERSVIDVWCERLGFERERFTGPTEPGPSGALGQSVAVLRRVGEV